MIKTTLLCFVVFGATNITAQNKSHLDIKKPLEERITLLMNQMTLEEKVGQMNQYNGFWEVTGPAPQGGSSKIKYDHLNRGLVGSLLNVRGVQKVREVQKIAVEKTRLGIPLIIGFDVIHGYKTLSPIPLAEAASWDMEAIKRSAAIAASEAAASGINWTFAPNVDVTTDARWGRVMEGAGEDPFLASKIAVARVKGFQGDNFSGTNTIAACAKHFAGYGFVESGKEYNNVDMSLSRLYNSVLPPFKAANDAGVKTFMNAFNTLNGIPATANRFLLRDILKTKWNFQGFVVSDWASIREMISHGYAKDGAEAAHKAAEAGSDMDMESYLYVNELANLVREKKVDIEVINNAVRRILRLKFEMGLFEDPYKYCNEKREKEVIGSISNHDGVLDMAKKSIVLLKNDNDLLPLKKSGQKIALIGALASDKTSPLGSWRIAAEDDTAISILEGMKKYKNSPVTYAPGTAVFAGKPTFTKELEINTTDKSGFEKAIATARQADVVVMVLGEHGFQSGEGRSRTNLDLPGNQQELLEEVFKVNKNIVLVLNNGRPLAIQWAADHIPAIVEAWQLGSQSGNAIAQVLYGDYNPSGKLPISFPRNVGQVPIYYNHYNTGRPTNSENNVFWSHYSDVDKTPLFPFGHGLSYTKFAYTGMTINKKTFSIGEPIDLSVSVTNTGSVDGKEVVQLYIRDVSGSISRPVKELKGFELISLKKGEQKTIRFTLNKEDLGYYDNNSNYLLEPGMFKVFVGTNSDQLLETEFELK
ncbi:beta-glucosidase BglX [Chryseobacterium sp. KACC 21268]|nr:beta-glucosidase BglX [Chryseobacterium sp. KACC 21268]